jgi:hypothetical protein
VKIRNGSDRRCVAGLKFVNKLVRKHKKSGERNSSTEKKIKKEY